MSSNRQNDTKKVNPTFFVSLPCHSDNMRMAWRVAAVAAIVVGTSALCPALNGGPDRPATPHLPPNHPPLTRSSDAPPLPGRASAASTRQYGAAVAALDLRAVQRDLKALFKDSQPEWPADWSDLPSGPNYG